MGAPFDIAAAHRRQTAFSTSSSGRDLQAAQSADGHNCPQSADSNRTEGSQFTSASPDMVTDAHHLHASMSGTLSNCSNCSETFRADSLAEMELQTSCTLLQEQCVMGNTMIEDRRHAQAPNALAANDDFPSFTFEQGSTRHPAVQWQRSLQRQSNLAHSPHHHSAAAHNSCLKQRPEGFSFWFADEVSGVSMASHRPFQGCIKSIEGKQGLQHSANLHVGSKRSRRLMFD